MKKSSRKGEAQQTTIEPKCIPDVPLDVFIEVRTLDTYLFHSGCEVLPYGSQIASHLVPADLLTLSRISKRVRQVLLSRSSRLVWAAARLNNVPKTPDPPSFVSEPLFACLMFGTECMVCYIQCFAG